MGAAIAPYNQVEDASPRATLASWGSRGSQPRSPQRGSPQSPLSPLFGGSSPGGTIRNLQAGQPSEGAAAGRRRSGRRGDATTSAGSDSDSDGEGNGFSQRLGKFFYGLGQSCAGDEEEGHLEWQVQVEGCWVPLSEDISRDLSAAQGENQRMVRVVDHRNREYMVDLLRYEQRNARGERNAIRCMRVASGGGIGLRRLWGMASTLLQRLRRNRSLVFLLLGVAFIIVALVILNGDGGGGAADAQPAPAGTVPAAGPPPETQPPTTAVPIVPPLVPASAGLWYVCAGAGQCGSATRQSWVTAPAALAASVAGNLGSAPGANAEAWRGVTDQWNNAPPTFKGSTVALEAIAVFIKDLLTSDPFMTGGQDVPWINLRPPSASKVVAVSQRQLAFIVANVLMGNTFANGAPNGLSAALQRCGGLDTGFRSYLLTLLSFLAVLSRELGPGSQGNMLVGAAPRDPDDSWKSRLGTTLTAPTVCKRVADGHFDCGLADFMSGGTPNQALTDIAGGVIGGGASLCNLATSQDESLVQFYSEVLAFAFFTDGGNPADSASGMLPVPFTMLGARRYMSDITGESMGNCGSIQGSNWLNEDIPTKVTATSLGGASVGIPSAAFVGVASVCSACNQGDCSQDDLINNKCDVQRRHLDQDVTNWYQAFEPMMYDPAVQGAYSAVVSRIGTGPWGAGVWYGDSQHSFLTVWLATGLLSGGIGLDYYIYPSFCENQGNQCFVLGSVEGCEVCVQHGALPGSGVNPGSCGLRSISNVIEQFNERPVADLYNALTQVAKPPRQVFDLLKDL